MTDSDTDETALEHINDFENLYHCGECRMVLCLERENRQITDNCPNCGPASFWRVS